MASESDPAETKANAEELLRQFRLGELLNQDQAGRRVSLLGTVNDEPALVQVERAPFPTSTEYLASLPATLARLRCLNANDIYSWHLGLLGGGGADADDEFFADLKINLVYPCTETHVNKYRRQAVRFVTETPEIYTRHVRPYMERRRGGGRLNWVYNIIDGVSEAEDVIFRTPPPGRAGGAGDEGFLLTPDLNWDRTTLESLRLLVLVERRDLWSVRDLRRRHVPWLRRMRERIVDATVDRFPGLEPDQVMLYFHYQPTYYHMHIHVVNAATEAGATQATGKAVGLESVIELLGAMEDTRAEEHGMAGVSMSYTLGEAHELWTEVFRPLKENHHHRHHQQQQTRE